MRIQREGTLWGLIIQREAIVGICFRLPDFKNSTKLCVDIPAKLVRDSNLYETFANKCLTETIIAEISNR